jgi:dihydrofolate reductase
MLSIIVAISDNLVIGRGNEIPWHIVYDLKHFRRMTEGKTIIVGRTTFEQLRNAYESRGKPMPDRNHIIVTSNHDYVVDLPKCFVVHSVPEAIEKAKEIETNEVFVAGGASLFKQTIDCADRLYLTKVHITVDGDAFFPDYSRFSKIISEEQLEEGEYHFTYSVLEPTV